MTNNIYPVQGIQPSSRVRRLGFAGAVVALLVLAAAAWSPRSDARGPSAQPSVIGGGDAKISDWPWQVALLQRDGRKFGQICGGSLVAPTVVLTAAHCVFRGQFLPAKEFRVVTGRTKLSSGEGQELRVKEIHVFEKPNGQPRYNSRTNDWDVVLLELKAPSTSTPIKIAGPDETALRAAGQDAWVTGWGATDKAGFNGSNKLKAAKVQINKKARCRTVYAEYDTGLMVCAGGGRPEHDACFGDSGGPLVVPMAGGGFRLIGDTSFGGQRCGAGATYGLVAGDPIRSSVQAEVLSIAGVDVVGSGAAPVAPTLPPNPFTASLARLRAEAYLFKVCDRNCYGAKAARCKARGASFKCKVRQFVLRGKRFRRFTLSRNLRITEKANGAIKAKPLRKWKRRRGGPPLSH